MMIAAAFPNFFNLLIYKGMYEDLRNLMSAKQHGFVKDQSTVSNLVVLNAVEDVC
jgi:hypothetical protein